MKKQEKPLHQISFEEACVRLSKEELSHWVNVRSQQTAGAEHLYIKAKEAKDSLVETISSYDNMVNAYAFLAKALGDALAGDLCEDEEYRMKLYDYYYNMALILEKCHELREAEAMISLLEEYRSKSKTA